MSTYSFAQHQYKLQAHKQIMHTHAPSLLHTLETGPTESFKNTAAPAIFRGQRKVWLGRMQEFHAWRLLRRSRQHTTDTDPRKRDENNFTEFAVLAG